MSKTTVVFFRINQAIVRCPFVARVLLAPIYFIGWFWMTLLMNAMFSPHAEVGPGFGLRHGGQGGVIHANSVVGKNCTMGVASCLDAIDGEQGAPLVGDDCYLGINTIVYGPVVIGDRVKTGANAVVITDLPSDVTAVGVPATVLTKQ